MQVESTLLFGSPAHSDQLAVELGAPSPLKGKKMLVPLTVRLPASAIALLPAGADGYAADLEVRVAAIDQKGDRSDVTILTWRVTRGQLPEGDETIEYATTLQVRRQPQDLVIAVYDTKSGALFSSTVRVAPVS